MPTTSVALEALRNCRAGLRAARLDAQTAEAKLCGARAARAAELASQLHRWLARSFDVAPIPA